MHLQLRYCWQSVLCTFTSKLISSVCLWRKEAQYKTSRKSLKSPVEHVSLGLSLMFAAANSQVSTGYDWKTTISRTENVSNFHAPE